jgi:hypothetical protein
VAIRFTVLSIKLFPTFITAEGKVDKSYLVLTTSIPVLQSISFAKRLYFSETGKKPYLPLLGSLNGKTEKQVINQAIYAM